MKSLPILVCSVFLLVLCDGLDRSKRQLMFPPESIMQLAFAVITPGEVKGRMLTTNLGIMFNINLPTNTSTWYPWRKDYRRRRDVEKDTHHAFYALIQNVMTMSGLDGRACLQKSFCQLEEYPVHNHDLPHQLLNLVFGSGRYKEDMYLDQSSNSSCQSAYAKCSLSPVDLFFYLYSSTLIRN